MEFTCAQGGEKAERVAIMTNKGVRHAVACPVHGPLAWFGYSSVNGLASEAGGTLGTYVGAGVGLADLENIPPGGFMNAAAGPFKGVWGVRPPRAAEPIVVATQYASVSSGMTDLTVAYPIQTPEWSGRLSGGVWYENAKET